jgi:hypothetical protein
MKLLTLLLLFTSVSAVAQTPDPEQAEIQRLSQLAALTPTSAEFAEVWQAYVRNYVDDMADADVAIEKIWQGAEKFRREIRVPNSGSGRPISGRELRNSMRAIAEAELEADRAEE